MATHTSVRYKISADGKTITEQVEGVKGNQCAIITSSIEEALGEVTSRKPTMAFYSDDERLQKLEEEDWIGTCTTFNCAFEPNPIEKRIANLEEEDWR
tara:strand:- start:24 stop:317 length:294 start_codon:yes stop_codon:yes gene_type:complete